MDPMTFICVTQFVHGLAYGLLLFLVAAGLSMIFGMMDILNLAHAYIFMLAAYLGYTMTGLLNFWAALLLAPIGVALLGMLIERFMLRKIHPLGHIPELVLTIGIGLILLEFVKWIWGTQSLMLQPPEILSGLLSIGVFRYPVYRVFIIGFSIAVMILMGLLFYKTRFGTIVRAATADAGMVGALGINVPLVYTLFFGFGTWLAGLAGVVVAPFLSVFPGLADQIGFDAFVVVVLGGLGSMSGAFIAAILIGLLNSFGIQFLPTLAPLLTFGLMAVVLSIKPTGLLGERQ
ncbi:MAG: branched-chain amino acid ABC transporter permease [Desulfobacterales bacterium]|nr:branched-chain amino acid ABC transporter permease [Desulfobacterales bacterium]MBS3756151.1 branched-chain amino acid ABC transporter permease [Desulfobacterales bacterium]